MSPILISLTSHNENSWDENPAVGLATGGLIAPAGERVSTFGGCSASATPSRETVCTPRWDLARDRVRRSRVMIVDDNPLNIKLIHKQLSEVGYSDFVTTTQPKEVLPLLREQLPDVLLLDIVMPDLDGLAILTSIRQDDVLAHLPVIMITAANDLNTMNQALERGATDFLDKPVHPTKLLPRVRNALVVKSHHDHLRHWAESLEAEVQRRTAELESSRLELIYCLGRAAEFRDNETGRHIIRVGRYVGLIARQLGMEEKAAFMLAQTAQLHDMGKIGIPDAILLKPGKLTPSEYCLMRQHSQIGNQTLSPFISDDLPALMEHTTVGQKILDGESPLLKLAASIAMTHHEKWDGTGYPRGLRGEEIPLEGRITAVADVFDALSSARPYKRPFAIEDCFRHMQAERGKHFDPRVLDAFLECKEDVLRIRDECADTTEEPAGRYRHSLPID
jgi:putative two-component system response regulator